MRNALGADADWAAGNVVVSAVVSAAMVLVALWFFRFKIKVVKRQKMMPSTEPVFPLGSLTDWDDLLRANKQILAKSEESQLPVAQWTFTTESVAVVRSEHVAQVLKASYSREMTPRLLSWLGMFHIVRFMGSKSVGVCEGQEWKSMRKAIGSSLRTPYIRGLYDEMVDCTNLITAWITQRISQNPAAGPGSVCIDVSDFTHALTLDIVCIATFKEKLGAIQGFLSGEPEPVVEAFKYASHEMARRASSFNPLDWMYWAFFRPEQRKLNDANRVIRECVRKVITRRLSKGMACEDNDLLRHLLGNYMDVESIGKDEDMESIPSAVVDNVITMCWAGHDTTASSLSFCLYLLAENPEIQTKLRSELENARREKGGRLDAQTVHNLPYLYAVMKETLRIHPPALWTNRGIKEDLVLFNQAKTKSIVLAKGSSVFIPIWAVHRSKQNWENPDAFKPERWLTSEGKPQADITGFCAFGQGKRECPGRNLAPFEFVTILSTIISQFKVSSCGHSPTIEACGMFQDCTDNVLRFTPIEQNCT